MFTVALSSRSLFMLEEEDKLFQSQGQQAFDQHMLATADKPLEPGAAFGLVRKLLAMNGKGTEHEKERVRVVLLSRNSPEAGLRVMNSVHTKGLAIESAVFTRGGNRFNYAKALKVDLFLCASEQDAIAASGLGIAAAVVRPSLGVDDDDKELRIAFDGDSTVFDDASDKVYGLSGVDGFIDHEVRFAGVPMEAGPFKRVVEKLSALSREVPAEIGRVRIALATMRSIPTHTRVFTTLREWGMQFDDLIMAGGLEKGPLLSAFEADFFLDDGSSNVDSAERHNVPAARAIKAVDAGTGEGLVARGA